jgi:hypothetical protein
MTRTASILLVLSFLGPASSFAAVKPAMVKGAAADSLIAELAKAGVKSVPGKKGEAVYTVSAMNCDTPDGSDMDAFFIPVCDLTVSSSIAPVTVKGAAATAIIAALDKAQVAATRADGAMSYAVGLVACSTPDGSDMDDMFLSVCEINQ